MSKVLFISGSPRQGNTDYVLKSVFKSIKHDKELILLRDQKIKHCTGCLSCHHQPQCVIKDDINQINQKVLDSDILVIGSPNYFDNVSGLLKDFIDRTHPFYKTKMLKNKGLILVMVGGNQVKISQEAINKTLAGFIKYHQLDLLKSYSFQGLNLGDVKKDPKSKRKIKDIVDFVKSP